MVAANESLRILIEFQRVDLLVLTGKWATCESFLL